MHNKLLFRARKTIVMLSNKGQKDVHLPATSHENIHTSPKKTKRKKNKGISSNLVILSSPVQLFLRKMLFCFVPLLNPYLHLLEDFV